MHIQCPSCRAGARLPESKEGAKVRCPQCSFVYVARPLTAKGASPRSRSSSLPIAIGTGLAALIVIGFLARDRGEAPVVTVEEPKRQEKPVAVDSLGWNSELVLLARKIHDDAFAQEEFSLGQNIDLASLWAAQTTRAGEEVTAADFHDLDPSRRVLAQAELLAELQSLEHDNLVAAWRPFDGSVLEERDDMAVVRLQVSPRDESLGVTMRWIDWRFARDGDRWRAQDWQRWISPAEERAMRIAAIPPRPEAIELSDGSIVYEADPRPIPYPDDVPQEVRDRIEGLIESMLDLDRRDQYEIRRELFGIGKVAVPPLLTRMYHQIEAGIETDEDLQRLTQVHMALVELTSFVTTWSPHEALGATRERQESGLRQWYSWYERKFKRFEVHVDDPDEDPFAEALAPRNEAEAREQERYRRAHDAAQADAARREAARAERGENR